MTHSRRERTIEQIRLLPEEKLPAIEDFLVRLECGDSSPL